MTEKTPGRRPRRTFSPEQRLDSIQHVISHGFMVPRQVNIGALPPRKPSSQGRIAFKVLAPIPFAPFTVAVVRLTTRRGTEQGVPTSSDEPHSTPGAHL